MKYFSFYMRSITFSSVVNTLYYKYCPTEPLEHTSVHSFSVHRQLAMSTTVCSDGT